MNPEPNNIFKNTFYFILHNNIHTSSASDNGIILDASIYAGLEELRLTGKEFQISDVGVYLGLGFKHLRRMDIDLGQRVSYLSSILHLYTL